MSYPSDVLEIQRNETVAVVRFRSCEFPNDSACEDCRLELEAYLDANDCDVLTFDLEGVAIIPSTMLGLMLTIRQRGIVIRIANPSEHVLAVLEITRLTSKIEVETATSIQ